MQTNNRILPSCEQCGFKVFRVVTAYWGKNVCPSCCSELATAFDTLNNWPAWPTEPPSDAWYPEAWLAESDQQRTLAVAS